MSEIKKSDLDDVMRELRKIRAGVDNLYATAGLDYSLDMMEIKLLLTDIKESVSR